MSTDNDNDRSGPERKREFFSEELDHSSTEKRFTDLFKSDDSDAEIINLMSDSSRDSSRNRHIYGDKHETPTGHAEQGPNKSRQSSLVRQKSSDFNKNSRNDDEKMVYTQSPNLNDEAHGATPGNSRRALSVPMGNSSKYVNIIKTTSSRNKSRKRDVGKTSKQNDLKGRLAGYVHKEKHTSETTGSVKGGKMQKKKNKTKLGENRKLDLTEQELCCLARKLVASPRLFRAFQQKMGEWITQNYGRMIDIFRRFDTDQSGTISYDEFFHGMNALGAPTTKAEMYIMATTLDADNDNAIDYREFAKLRRQYRAASGSFEKTADLPSAESPIITQVQLLQPCSRCEVGVWEPVDEDMPRLVCLNLGWSSSHENESYPQCFCATVQSATSIHGVSRAVKKELGHCVMNITIYRPLEGRQRELLSPEKKLSDYGFPGTLPPEPPEEVTLLYDYEYPFLDCPLLMADLQLTRKQKDRDENTSRVTQVKQAERTSDATCP